LSSPESGGEVRAWPPKKEDLEDLYLGRRLSAMKIAKVYGLEYDSPKTAESTVLYHLRRLGYRGGTPSSTSGRWTRRPLTGGCGGTKAGSH
jgi:hypothetical protein